VERTKGSPKALSAAAELLKVVAPGKAKSMLVSDSFDALFEAAMAPDHIIKNKAALENDTIRNILISYMDGSFARSVLSKEKYLTYRRDRLEYTAHVLREIRKPLLEAGAPSAVPHELKQGWSSAVKEPREFRRLTLLRSIYRSNFEGLLLSAYGAGQFSRDDLIEFTRKADYTEGETGRLQQMLEKIDNEAAKQP